MKYGILPKLRRVADEPSGRVSIGGGTRVDRGDEKGAWCLACGTSVNRNSLRKKVSQPSFRQLARQGGIDVTRDNCLPRQQSDRRSDVS